MIAVQLSVVSCQMSVRKEAGAGREKDEQRRRMIGNRPPAREWRCDPFQNPPRSLLTTDN